MTKILRVVLASMGPVLAHLEREETIMEISHLATKGKPRPLGTWNSRMWLHIPTTEQENSK